MIKLNKNQYKSVIETIEYYNNGFNHLSGYSVIARRVKLLGNKVFANVILIDKNNIQKRINYFEYYKKDLTAYAEKYLI